MSGDILRLDEITDASVGGKAYGLSRLAAMGLAVPPTFVIRDARSGSHRDDLEQHLRLIGDVVAVRSSAQGEDGSDASFAGQYETVLGVRGIAALHAAIDHCVASAGAERAQRYRQDQLGDCTTSMNVVVQRMVDARVAGVVFTADPVSARRDLLVIDAVAGLGEVLVSGGATPDHYAVNRTGDVVRRHLVGATPLLSDEQIAAITQQARAAADHEGHPLDLEWAIDHAGELFWLQARPITTLPADPNEFDTTLPRHGDVLTISNASEMMPGAMCPLTMSFTGSGIDHGLQHMQVTVGARERIEQDWQVTASAYGHLFLNLTGNVVLSAAVLGSSAEQTAQTICGRSVPELAEPPPLPLRRRVLNSTRLLRYCLEAPRVVERFDRDVDRFQITLLDDSPAMWSEIAGKSWFFDHAMAVHIQSSALSGFLGAIVENMVSARSSTSSAAEQAETARLLAGASGVESAVMLDELDSLIDLVLRQRDCASDFLGTPAADAVQWLRSTPGVRDGFERFLGNHGHRGYRELCVRDPSWGDDPTPLVQSMQAAVHARLVTGGDREQRVDEIERSDLGRALRWTLPRAHRAIRRREHTKSRLVDVAHRFQVAFRHLGSLMESEGLLPDADLVNFLTTREIPGFIASPSDAMVATTIARRNVLEYQQTLEFPETSVGLPEPLEPQPTDLGDGVLQGRPASRGVVEGTVRVAHTLTDAASLEPGEILVTPVTDIGWTPYFSLIAGLVTDLGSSVSHGAVIAREYGLPCVVNTRRGTHVLRTGDRVRLDGDAGTVTLQMGQRDE
jgi:phosphohistidine swiveling domain-containing protein